MAQMKEEIKQAKELAQKQQNQQAQMQNKVKQAQAKQEQEEQMREQRRIILKAILSPEARQRCM